VKDGAITVKNGLVHLGMRVHHLVTAANWPRRRRSLGPSSARRG
jgi:hypothetical protein